MERVWQEFYCNLSGGGCGGYILVKINVAINHMFVVVCPKCKHQHERVVENGQIKDNYTKTSKSSFKEELIPTMAAYSKKPRTMAMKKRREGERNAAVIRDASDFADESWFERHALPEDVE